MKNIPIVVGVTGHRLLKKQDYPVLQQKVKSELTKIKELCPNSSLVLLDSIASGADSLCAKIALELGYELAIPLPFEQKEYRKDFKGDDLKTYDDLLNKANVVFEVTSIKKDKNRDRGYLEAGLYIAKHSHVLLTLWDGTDPKIDGCATAEVVDYAMKGVDESIIVPTPIATIIHIYAPRVSTKNIKVVGYIKVYESKEGSTKECLINTDEFNKECNCNIVGNSIVEKDVLNKLDNDLRYYDELYSKADALSIIYQKKYLNSLKVLSVLGFLLALSYLLYDEMDLKPLSILLIVFICINFYYMKKHKKGKWHEKYLSYRTLAESIRIQFFVIANGLNNNVGDLFPWAIREDNDWIFKTLKVLEPVGIDHAKLSREEIVNIWVNDQIDYHNKAANRDGLSLKRNNRFTLILTVLSIVLYGLVAVLEYAPHSAIMNNTVIICYSSLWFIDGKVELIVRGLFKILTGVTAAITLLITNYYGKLSLDNKQEDHQRYVSLYEESKKVIKNPTDELIWELASEELFANSAWLTYSKENSPNGII